MIGAIHDAPIVGFGIGRFVNCPIILGQGHMKVITVKDKEYNYLKFVIKEAVNGGRNTQH